MSKTNNKKIHYRFIVLGNLNENINLKKQYFSTCVGDKSIHKSAFSFSSINLRGRLHSLETIKFGRSVTIFVK